MSKDINDLERDVETERGLLDRALGQLTEAMSPQRVSATLTNEFKARGGTLGKTAMDMARANPAGALLLGLGAVALLAGPRHPTNRPAYAKGSNDTPETRLRDDVLTDEFDERVAAAEAAGPRAPRMRAALNKGLANLPEPARKRVLQARTAAIDLQEKLDRNAALAARKARSIHRRQPFLSAAVAAGFGAIAAALLPRSRFEDETMGAQRDALMQQAEFALHDELRRLGDAGGAAVRDGMEAGYESLRNH